MVNDQKNYFMVVGLGIVVAVVIIVAEVKNLVVLVNVVKVDYVDHMKVKLVFAKIL